MFPCANCGILVKEDDSICPYCGRRTRITDRDRGEVPEPGPGPGDSSPAAPASPVSVMESREAELRAAVVRVSRILMLILAFAAVIAGLVFESEASRYRVTEERIAVAQREVPALSAATRVGDAGRITFTDIEAHLLAGSRDWRNPVPGAYFLRVKGTDGKDYVLRLTGITPQHMPEKRIPGLDWVDGEPVMTSREITVYGTLLRSTLVISGYGGTEGENLMLLKFFGLPALDLTQDTYYTTVKRGDPARAKSLSDTRTLLFVAAIVLFTAAALIRLFTADSKTRKR